MSTQQELDTIHKFSHLVHVYYSAVNDEFNEYKNDPGKKGLLNCLKIKYPYLKRGKIGKRSDITKIKASIQELLESDLRPLENKDDKQLSINESFTDEDRMVIMKYCINKIRGLYKHAQALKTGFCNGQIINSFSEKNTISVCITKNTLEANEQWLTRLFKELDNRYPSVSLEDKIMIISSKKNTLGGNATHCKDINHAWGYLKKSNQFKILFICSNKIRILDVLEISEGFLNLRVNLQKNLRVIHDEAHNTNEGIPPFRNIIENIIAQPNILSYQPTTASPHTIYDEVNPIWKKENLESHAINFTEFDNTKSTDENYSSCSDAIRISFEGDKISSHLVDYKVTEVSRELFMEVTDVYKNVPFDTLDQDQEDDIDNRRCLEFCQFMKNNKEIEAVNNGLNVLNLNNILDFEYYKKDVFDITVIATPKRRVITRFLAIKATEMDYNPLVLAVYGTQGEKYHLFDENNPCVCVDNIMKDGEFNTKLDRLIKHLKKQGVNMNRPFLIIGNYNPTGESLTFVNYTYGTVKGVFRLISTNAEEDYQTACRGNYMNTKFRQHDHNWKNPTKYLIGPKQFIDNSLSYEKENDARNDELASRAGIAVDGPGPVVVNIPKPKDEKDGTVAIPMKITLDRNDPTVQQLINITKLTRRTKDDKKLFMKLLIKCYKDDEINFKIEDKSKKFLDWVNEKTTTDFTLKDFRCFQQNKDGTPKIPENGYWKFSLYQNHFKVGTPFMNDKNNHTQFQCELLSCNQKYVFKNEKDNTKEINFTDVWWMGYKY